MTAGDPTLLLEASRIFNQAGEAYRPLAEIVSALALTVVDKADVDADVRAAILCDAAALRLSGRVKDEIGWQSALALLDKISPTYNGSEFIRLHILLAFANGQQYRDLTKQSPATAIGDVQMRLRTLSEQIIGDLRIVFAHDKDLVRVSRHFWDPGAPLRSHIDGFAADQEDDWHALFSREAGFRDFIDEATGLQPAEADPGAHAAR